MKGRKREKTTLLWNSKALEEYILQDPKIFEILLKFENEVKFLSLGLGKFLLKYTIKKKLTPGILK